MVNTCQASEVSTRICTRSGPDIHRICTGYAPNPIRICTDGFDVTMSAALVVVKTGSLKCDHMFPLLFLCDRDVRHPNSKINRRTESIIQSNGQIISAIGPKRTQTSQMTHRVFNPVPRVPGLTKQLHSQGVVATTHFPLVEH